MYSTQAAQASNFVEGVDLTFMIILGVAIFFIIAITALMIIFIVKYRKSKHPNASQIHGNTKLEMLWTGIPTALVLVMFWFGWAGWKPMKTVPKDAMVIKSLARMWSWKFEYPNGKITDTLFVPVDKPVKVALKALDVIHSMYIPAFRVKEDMVPGTDGMMWFEPQKIGTYDLFCTEYCGLRHSYMTTAVVVMDNNKFDSWLGDTTTTTLIAGGKGEMPGHIILRNNGCNACHTSDGSKLVGPSYKGLFGMTKTVITNGEERQVTVDGEYIKRAIYEPNADIVKGYNKGLMLSYKGMVDDHEIELIIEYLKTLK